MYIIIAGRNPQPPALNDSLVTDCNECKNKPKLDNFTKFWPSNNNIVINNKKHTQTKITSKILKGHGFQ